MVGSGFIPKSHIMQISCNNNNRNNKQEIKESENHGIKKETIIIRYFLLSRNKEKK
ncbi:MAG: hypothetical protein JO327_05315 [Nitrososphaeraceae archaeon]|nr:hypothetical protein [Nitrososphaeraceae archaeon]